MGYTFVLMQDLLEIEGDALSLFTALDSTVDDLSDVGTILDEAKHLISHFEACSWNFIPRSVVSERCWKRWASRSTLTESSDDQICGVSRLWVAASWGFREQGQLWRGGARGFCDASLKFGVVVDLSADRRRTLEVEDDEGEIGW
ncbi:hypothetical protein ACLB2K_072826 [Fragaria x ananassa]